MLIGIVAGTYSTVFIASAIAVLLSGIHPTMPGPQRGGAGTNRGTKPARPSPPFILHG